MVNMNVKYQRSCKSLLTMQSEIRERFGAEREQNKGFITGYPDGARGGAKSGHYPDNNGITFGYDIGVDIEGDGTGLKLSDAEWLANYLCEEMHPRFQYLIYRGRIRGNHTGWRWAPYYGSSPHNDHIHVSVVDVVYGEPSGISSAVFDSTTPWGVAASVDFSGGGPRPIDPEPAKPEPEPAKPAPQFLTIPAGVESWAVYKLGVAPVAGSQFNGINTKEHGALTYEISGWAIPGKVAIIETAQLGKVQIYVAPGTGAVVSDRIPERPASKPKEKPKPAPKPEPATGLYAYLGRSATSWNIYRPGVAPRDGNEFMKLNPRRNSYHRKYPFIKWVGKNVALISTSAGSMQIYIGKETGGYVGR